MNAKTDTWVDLRRYILWVAVPGSIAVVAILLYLLPFPPFPGLLEASYGLTVACYAIAPLFAGGLAQWLGWAVVPSFVSHDPSKSLKNIKKSMKPFRIVPWLLMVCVMVVFGATAWWLGLVVSVGVIAQMLLRLGMVFSDPQLVEVHFEKLSGAPLNRGDYVPCLREPDNLAFCRMDRFDRPIWLAAMSASLGSYFVLMGDAMVHACFGLTAVQAAWVVGGAGALAVCGAQCFQRAVFAKAPTDVASFGRHLLKCVAAALLLTPVMVLYPMGSVFVASAPGIGAMLAWAASLGAVTVTAQLLLVVGMLAAAFLGASVFALGLRSLAESVPASYPLVRYGLQQFTRLLMFSVPIIMLVALYSPGLIAASVSSEALVALDVLGACALVTVGFVAFAYANWRNAESEKALRQTQFPLQVQTKPAPVLRKTPSQQPTDCASIQDKLAAMPEEKPSYRPPTQHELAPMPEEKPSYRPPTQHELVAMRASLLGESTMPRKGNSTQPGRP